MRKEIEKEVSKLTIEETKDLFDRLNAIFKGGVKINNIQDMKKTMTEYLKSIN